MADAVIQRTVSIARKLHDYVMAKTLFRLHLRVYID